MTDQQERYVSFKMLNSSSSRITITQKSLDYFLVLKIKYSARNVTSEEILIGYVSVHELKVIKPDFAKKVPTLTTIVNTTKLVILPQLANKNDPTVPVKVQVQNLKQIPEFIEVIIPE